MKKLLIIEDDKVDQMAFKRFVKSSEFPYTYVLVDSIRKAKEALQTNNFDAIVSDFFLGDGTAFEILELKPGIPVVVVTGTGSEEIAVEALKKGAFDYLIKDIEGLFLKMLPITVENALTRYHTKKELQQYHENLENLVEKRTAELRKEMAERKKAEEEIIIYRDHLEKLVSERTAQLEDLNKDLERFSYSISHDLKAPLRHIDGFTQMLNKSLTITSKESQRYFDKIRESSLKMGSMIDHLLEFSRVGRKAIKKVPVDLNDLVKNTMETLKSEIAPRNIKWDIGTLPSVQCDAQLMQLVFDNLISNAIKYTSKKEKAIIEIDTDTNKKKPCTFYIKDNGAGFDMDFADKLFGVFQRLHSDEEFEGIGIGLANVKQIIHKHGGEVWVEAKRERGACFFVSI